VNLEPLLKEAWTLVKRNYTITLPTIFSIFVVSFLALGIIGSPEDASGIALVSFLSGIISLYAHGVTLVMADEALVSGSTSLRTAGRAAGRFFLPFALASVIISVVVGLGLALFLVPGLIAAYFLMFAMTAVAVDGAGALTALSRSYRVVRGSAREAFVLFVFLFVAALAFGLLNLVLSVIPVVGQLAGVILSGIFGGGAAVLLVRTYRDLTAAARHPSSQMSL
jgi:hypothetical protein